jgi:hypothetical protein
VDDREDDGFELARANVRKGRSQMLAVEDLYAAAPLDPDDLIRRTCAIIYRDSRGNESERWITIDRVNGDPPESLTAYCWVRRASRTFRMERIEEIFGDDGEVIDREAFLDLFTDEAVAPPTPPRAPRAGTPRTGTRPAEGGGLKALAAAEARIGNSQAPKASVGGSFDVSWPKTVVLLMALGLGSFGAIDAGLGVGLMLLATLAGIAGLVGLIWPRAVLPAARAKRATAVLVYILGGVALAVLAGLVG